MPWHLYKDHPEADGDIPEDKVVEADAGVEVPKMDSNLPPIVVKTRQKPPRAFQIRREDAEKHGYTRGRQPHSPECRASICPNSLR